jgi:DNA-binding NarL/FixJ family response regulator
VLNNKTSVFLVAGNDLLREMLARLLNKRREFHVCGVSPCVPSIASAVAASGADILILDSSAARLADSVFVSEIVNQIPLIKIVLIDMNCDREAFLESVRAASAAEVMIPSR